MSKKNIHRAMMTGAGRCAIDKNYRGPLDKHHIHGRECEDWDASWNIIYVSPNVHRQIHEGEIIIEGWFMSSEGRILLWHKKGEKPTTDSVACPYLIKRKSFSINETENMRFQS
jgi:hypothetical protein